ncbi:SUMF1/EgtB/PvdO family nonheme iron enzyme [Spirosoma fluviale]|uniref:Formylglycine-generating enzyme, required for sulfatase activity, contains SUMF1/FGE domain n=1 Tax=Spirosoma fluviale TaxID=1597977 RepID=A0A286GLT1_9BACT|nr:SUMF1/EgtB/PvdO family nonheme iron enzyme [Spirosoma fluviale]SOD96452.1 Formylglycine-generating enzyme, required for sulfatase activity, contains SUMF1/FGE domain [Spirosoma fluviale]
MKPILYCLLLLLLWQPLLAQDKTLGIVQLHKNTREGQRKALIIANQTYQFQKSLNNTLRDADSMAVALRYLGFQVTVVKDKTLADTQDAIDRFEQSLQPADVAFVYYSGHGLGYQHDNYLLPVEFAISEMDGLKNRAISFANLRSRIVGRSVRNLFMVVDACRSEMADKATDRAYELVPPENNPPGTLIAFATDYGQTATYKSRNNKNSLYTESLLMYLRQPLEVQEIFKRANNRTYAETQRLKLSTQHPHYIPMIYDDYYFLKLITPNTPSPPRPQTRQYLDLPFAEMVYIPGGTFQMGDKYEVPVHTVTVSPFLIGKYEVTQRQWETVMGSNPSHFKDCPDCPVENVSWDDVQEFLKKLNARTGGNYRLPTEAEWEYAAGGGASTRTRFGNGRNELDSTNANYDTRRWATHPKIPLSNKYRAKTLQVGSFTANTLGLHDMSGNVWEWCADWYGPYGSSSQTNPTGPATGISRVLRGGSWNYFPQDARVANRGSNSPSNRDNYIGFRVVSQAQ